MKEIPDWAFNALTKGITQEDPEQYLNYQGLVEVVTVKQEQAHEILRALEWFRKHNEHEYYRTGDFDAPEAIKDRNNEVVLDMCRKCGRAESELTEKCDNAMLY